MISPSITSCNAAATIMAPRPRKLLARHQTIRRMEDTSTRTTVESRYKVNWNEPLGEGAFGAVYLATDRKSGNTVALKKINKKFTDDVSFQREMNALMHLRQNGGHPNICSLHENFDEGGYYYLVLDLVSGGEMFDSLVRQGAYSEADAARLVREVASALAFLHGIGCVHGDMKPENVMLSTEKASDAVVKLVDFGCAQVSAEDSAFPLGKANGDDGGDMSHTPAYCPPEVLDERRSASAANEPSMDMWALGVILYIMLTGLHPFDLEGNATDEEIKRHIQNKAGPPLKNSPFTAHLSKDAIDVIQRLLTWNPKKRMTALQMLEHPWVRGETARRDIMADSDKKLSTFRKFKSGLELRVFEDIVNWADENDSDISRRTSLIERSFHSLDPQHKGYITAKDLRRLGSKGAPSAGGDEEDESLTLSGFSNLLSDHMKNKYFPKGHVLYREGDKGNHMYLINSGTIEITTKKGFRIRLTQGDFFGEGALFHPKGIRSGTVKCVTPVHVIEINREYFEKYLSKSWDLNLNLREKHRKRKRHRAQAVLRLQQDMHERTFRKGEHIFLAEEEGQELFILEEGKADVIVEDHVVFQVKPGDMCGLHSLLFSRPRNASAVCVSDTCRVQVMPARAFFAFLDSSPSIKESLLELAMRREFQKAIVFKTKKSFPSKPKDLRAAFDAADEDNSGVVSLDNVRTMLKRMDPSLTEKDVQSILKALDIDESGHVSFEEFKRIFQLDKAEGLRA